jgi:hypothetical protein
VPELREPLGASVRGLMEPSGRGSMGTRT